ncbi:MAG: phosphatase PAP2 family protein [Nocardioidaceae bacterium]
MSFAARSPGHRTVADRSWPARMGVLVVAWLILLGLVVGIGRLLTGPLEGSVGSSENDLARSLVGERTSSLNDVAGFLTMLGDTRTVLVLAPVVALGVGLWRRDIRPALFVALTTTGASGLYILAANVDPRPRPPVKILDPGLDPLHSFPSGHVAAATALYGLIIVLVWTYARAARYGATALLLLPVLVVMARLYEGAHHLSDVLTSLVYAATWLGVTTRTLLPRHSTGESAQRADH